MLRRKLAFVFAALILTGCSTKVEMPPLTKGHPAHPDAPEAPSTLSSKTLADDQLPSELRPDRTSENHKMHHRGHGESKKRHRDIKDMDQEMQHNNRMRGERSGEESESTDRSFDTQ